MLKLFTPFIGGRAGVGLLIFRIFTGLALMLHGMSKIQHPFTWMDAMHPGMPAFLQACSAVAEFGGGLALIIGLLTPLACLGIFINMMAAIFLAHVPQGGHWIGGPHSFESAASYALASVLLFLTGPGTISLDAKLFRRTELVDRVYLEERETVGTLRP